MHDATGLDIVRRAFEEVPKDRCWLKAPGWALAYS
jgi:hypothetical protein